METHLAELIWIVHDAINSIHLVLLRAFKQHRKLLTILFGPGEVPTPELSSSSSCSHPDKRLKAGVLAQMSPLPDSSWSPLHSRRLTLSRSCISVHVQMSQRTLLWCWIGCLWIYPRMCLSPTSQRTHHNSNDTAPHPKPYSKDWFFRSFLSLCISLHRVGRGSSLTGWDIVEVHLILNCNVIFLTLEKSLLSYV